MFDSVKIFTASRHSERITIGERVTEWLRENRGIQVVDIVIRQSSDYEYHCITFIIFYRHAAVKRRRLAS